MQCVVASDGHRGSVTNPGHYTVGTVMQQQSEAGSRG